MPKKSSLVYKQIADRIKAGVFPARSRLPNELELSREFGVSRSVVREALSALEIVDIIERRAGDGTYIREASVANLRAGLSHEPIILQTFKKIEECGGSFTAFEARSLTEPILAGIAAMRADERDIAEIKALCATFKQALNDFDKELFRKTDVDFHRRIANSSKNELLEAFLLHLIEAEKYLLWRKEINWPTRERMSLSVNEHITVANAIFDRDYGAAVEAMQRHFVFHWDEMARLMKEIGISDCNFSTPLEFMSVLKSEA
ncbi:MAG: FadR family transcriptional regulator [Synergistaceae bacterium]|jgi:GntR family transcriptional repressor for pyruvate dehydrogenase complex|nr:FadR family transcriptional regulator [Synergistaceae bacterium]